MRDNDSYNHDFDEEFYPEKLGDKKVEEAKHELKMFFEQNKQEVFYLKQLEVRFEKKYFHWITSRAINELLEEDKIRAEEIPLAAWTKVKFLFNKRHMYYKRQIKEAIEIIRDYSSPTIASACGRQAEMLFFNALAHRGFKSLGHDVNEYLGKRWTDTNHNLDFVIERDNITYGCEIKNTFDYIDKMELFIKLEMCRHFDIKPLFIMRYSPKTYNHEIIQRGGYVMIFETQIYPYGQEEIVKKIKEKLKLPVDCPRAIPEGIIERFIKWHQKNLVCEFKK